MISFKEAVSQRILELCEKYGYSLNRLSELSATPPTTFRVLAAAKVKNPSSYIIYRVCRALNISLKEFFDSEIFNFDNIND